jgi:signal transduction histidine kinase
MGSVGQEARDSVAPVATPPIALVQNTSSQPGLLMLAPVDFNLRELCETVGLLMAVPAQAKGLELNCFIHPDLRAELRGDATRLRQILVNLIGNAVKFALHGEVSVDVRRLSADERGSLIQFSVKDTGIGMRGAAMERLFKPFEQAEQGATRRFGGTGL